MLEIIIFWLPLGLVLYSYLIYPLFIYLLALNKHNNSITYSQNEELPMVSVVLSVYNEEKWIEQRIRNIYATNYKTDKIEILVGSDGSSDLTNTILYRLKEQYKTLKIFIFNNRNGKAYILNHLIAEATGDILVFTDSKILFSPQAIFQLVKHFKNEDIGIVGGNIVNKRFQTEGISIPEKKYMNLEIRTKYNEGKIFGSTIGVYGACYAIRKDSFANFPDGCVVDDFFQNMKILNSGKKSIIEINALCYEDVPDSLEEEFRRKIRISVGNFQNLHYFKHLLSKPNHIGFCFFSHKIIRWFGPFLLLWVFLSNSLLITKNYIYLYLFATQVILLLLPIIDYFLHNIRRDILILRFVTHFYFMNIALAIGFVKYLKGEKLNVWEPTTR